MIYLTLKGNINGAMLAELIAANRGKRGFTYTHHVLNSINTAYIKVANRDGFTINVSTESKADAVSAYNQGMPTVVVVPSDHADNCEHEGVKFVTCPAQTNDTMTCAQCGLCSQSNRTCVVMFKAHGNAKRFVSTIVS